ncbi:MAG TPA: S41 family peptidase [Polyangiaceae bacterium]|nr:S41 family peptidase [Polyangiaceae bacterium]
MALLSAGPARATSARESPYELFDQFGRVLAWVENEYVDPVERARLVEGALEGMVGELDPHSAYLAPEDYAIFRSDTEGQFGGIGVEVDFSGEWVTVIAPIEGSPAARAGIRSGDRILAIDHSTVRGKSPVDLVKRMRGEPGSRVLLTLRREGLEKLLYFTLTREVIDVKSVASKLLTGDVGYLRIKAFQQGTHTELLEHVAALRSGASGGIRGWLLDLRNNPGGLVDEATAVADELLASGVVFTTRRRDAVVDELRATPGGVLRRGPLVVLVNEFTASSAEIVAGALKDNGRARLVGAKTFGKGSVQTIVDLPGGAGLRLTTLRYYTPRGRAIQAQGLEPDIFVASPGGEFGVMRERNLEGHLPEEFGAPVVTPPPASDPSALREPLGEASLGVEVPTDPRLGKDVALATAYRLLIGE